MVSQDRVHNEIHTTEKALLSQVFLKVIMAKDVGLSGCVCTRVSCYYCSVRLSSSHLSLGTDGIQVCVCPERYRQPIPPMYTQADVNIRLPDKNEQVL